MSETCRFEDDRPYKLSTCAEQSCTLEIPTAVHTNQTFHFILYVCLLDEGHSMWWQLVTRVSCDCGWAEISVFATVSYCIPPHSLAQHRTQRKPGGVITLLIWKLLKRSKRGRASKGICTIYLTVNSTHSRKWFLQVRVYHYAKLNIICLTEFT